jgi:hypothetical protein
VLPDILARLALRNGGARWSPPKGRGDRNKNLRITTYGK